MASVAVGISCMGLLSWVGNRESGPILAVPLNSAPPYSLGHSLKNGRSNALNNYYYSSLFTCYQKYS
jgi:hypothetical protein